ncbi:MAG TPA: hypothetical protein PKX20_03020, partial [Methanothrix soehngenii]|nr:hypothetical protein [Methanothrix soehngenii]
IHAALSFPALLKSDLGLPGDERAFRALWAIAHLTGKRSSAFPGQSVTHNIETADDIAVLQKGSRLLYGIRDIRFLIIQDDGCSGKA